MKIDILTLFPEMFSGPFEKSIIGRAQRRGLVKIKIHQLRDWAINKPREISQSDNFAKGKIISRGKYGQVDDRPYGGGAGMLLRVDVAYSALNSLLQKNHKSQITNYKQIPNSKSQKNKPCVVLPTPSGKKFNQQLAVKLAKKKHLVFLCPHYEGYDHRIESLVDEKISIGDYILTGGELPVMCIVDAVVRLIPGVIKEESLQEESFSQNSKFQITNDKQISNSKSQIQNPNKLKSYHSASSSWPRGKLQANLEYPQYTRPEVWKAIMRGKKIKKRVPKVLLSGNHKKIAEWRRKMTED